MGYHLQEVVCFLGLALAFACVSTAMAQYPAGLSSTGPEAALSDQKGREARANAGSYHLKIGQVRFKIGLGLNQEYNDNITLSKGALQESDFITTPNVDLNVFWPFSKLNTLDMGLGLGYSKYWQHPDLDTQSLLIDPKSLLDFNIYVGDIRFTLYEKISIQEDPISQPQLSGTSKFRRLENTMGIRANWDLNRIVLGGGYDRYTFKALDKGGSVTTNNGQTANQGGNGTTNNGQTVGGLDHDVDSLFGQIGYKMNPKMLAGLRGNFSETTYSGTQQNGSSSKSVAIFLDGELTHHISAGLSAGYQMQTFASGGSINDNSNFESYIFQMSVKHEVNRFFSHNLSLSRYSLAGIGTNFSETQEFDYSVDWDFIKDVQLTASAFFQTLKDSGAGPNSESADRYGLSLKGVHKLFRSWDLGLGYDLMVKDSNIPENDYLQNRVYLNLTYSF